MTKRPSGLLGFRFPLMALGLLGLLAAMGAGLACLPPR